jgi:hypothetical protein
VFGEEVLNETGFEQKVGIHHATEWRTCGLPSRIPGLIAMRDWALRAGSLDHRYVEKMRGRFDGRPDRPCRIASITCHNHFERFGWSSLGAEGKDGSSHERGTRGMYREHDRNPRPVGLSTDDGRS